MSDEDSGANPADMLDQVASLLDEAKTGPANEFRSALARRLAAEDPGWGPRPDGLWPWALALVIVGVGLLLLGALLSVGGI